MVTLRRRLLGLARHLGVDVVNVGPGAAFLTVHGRTRKGQQRSPYQTVRLGSRTVAATPRTLPRPQEYERERATYRWLAEEHLRHVLRKYQVNCVLDVGANKGQYVRTLRRIGYRGHVVSFEPVPGVFQDLERAAARDRRWAALQVALGREDGSLTMHMVPGTCSSAFPASEYGAHRFAQLRQSTTVDVPVRRLDGLLDEILPDGIDEPRIFLKLDTQGFDLEAFAGLGDRHKMVVAMQSEIALLQIYDGMPRMPEALAAYEGAGFEITGLFPVTHDHDTARVIEYDCVMAQSSAAIPESA
jgi:FkbM family methyltransferase